MKKPTEADLCLGCQLRELGVRGVVREFQFHPTRKWKIDFFVPAHELGIEVEGGIHGIWDKAGRWQKGQHGRHTREKGFIEDARKYAEATVLGITIFRFPTEMILTGESQKFLKRWLERPL